MSFVIKVIFFRGLFFSPSEPLILTQKSHTALKSYNRYVDTVYHTNNWYMRDPWETNGGFKVRDIYKV